jgi:hypothetical protein
VADKPRGAESDEPVAHFLPQGKRELQVACQFDLRRELGEQLVPQCRSACCARRAGSMAVSWMWISDVTRCPPASAAPTCATSSPAGSPYFYKELLC